MTPSTEREIVQFAVYLNTNPPGRFSDIQTLAEQIVHDVKAGLCVSLIDNGRLQIAELIGSLTDAKLALAEAKDDMVAKEKEIDRLKAAFEAKAKLAKGPDDYDYKADDEGRPIGYPICPKCQETDGRIVQLKQNIKHNAGQCPVCEKEYKPVTAFLHYEGGTPYTKQNEYDDKVAAMNKRQAEGMERLGEQLGRNSWMAR